MFLMKNDHQHRPEADVTHSVPSHPDFVGPI